MKVCITCGKLFEAKSVRYKYCSVACRNEYYNRKKDKLDKKSSTYEKSDFDERACDVCGEIFKPNREDNRYCSKECRDRGMKIYYKESRRKAIIKLADGEEPKCAICECPHIEALTIGHPNNDGKEHRKELKKQGITILKWILKTNIEQVMTKIQLECAYCQFYFTWNGEYPSKNKQPKW